MDEKGLIQAPFESQWGIEVKVTPVSPLGKREKFRRDK